MESELIDYEKKPHLRDWNESEYSKKNNWSYYLFFRKIWSENFTFLFLPFTALPPLHCLAVPHRSAPPIRFKCTKYSFYFPFLCALCTSIVVRKMINDSVKSFSVQRSGGDGGGGNDGNSSRTPICAIVQCTLEDKNPGFGANQIHRRYARRMYEFCKMPYCRMRQLLKLHCTDNIGSLIHRETLYVYIYICTQYRKIIITYGKEKEKFLSFGCRHQFWRN